MLSGIVAETAGELEAQFLTVEPGRIKQCAEVTAQQLRGSVCLEALPEMLVRLVRHRLLVELLDGDRDAAVELTAATNRAALGDVVRSIARSRVDCAGVTFVLREGGNCFYAGEDAIAPLWAGQRFPITSCITGWAMLHAQSVVVDDVEKDARVPQAAYRSTFVRSLAVAPVFGWDGATAAIGAYWPHCRGASAAALALLEGVAAAATATLIALGGD